MKIAESEADQKNVNQHRCGFAKLFLTADYSEFVLDGAGRPAFYDLMKRRCQAVYYAFDIIWLNGRDLRELSLLERKKIYGRLAPCSLRQLQLRIFGGTSSIVDGWVDLGGE